MSLEVGKFYYRIKTPSVVIRTALYKGAVVGEQSKPWYITQLGTEGWAPANRTQIQKWLTDALAWAQQDEERLKKGYADAVEYRKQAQEDYDEAKEDEERVYEAYQAAIAYRQKTQADYSNQ